MSQWLRLCSVIESKVFLFSSVPMYLGMVLVAQTPSQEAPTIKGEVEAEITIKATLHRQKAIKYITFRNKSMNINLKFNSNNLIKW